MGIASRNRNRWKMTSLQVAILHEDLALSSVKMWENIPEITLIRKIRENLSGGQRSAYIKKENQKNNFHKTMNHEEMQFYVCEIDLNKY